MQKISVDLTRLAVSTVVICAAVGTAEFKSLHHGGSFIIAKTRIASPIQVKAISVGAPALCWTIDEPIGASTTQDAQAERAAVAQTCSRVAPSLRRLSEPQSRLALTLESPRSRAASEQLDALAIGRGPNSRHDRRNRA
jgi:hypothetical protein